MQSQSGLLQYYVHQMLKHRNIQQQHSSLSRLPKKFRSRVAKSFIVHEYNFVQQQDSKSPERSPYQQLVEIASRAGRKTMHHKRASLQEEHSQSEQKKRDEGQLGRLTDSKFYTPKLLGAMAYRQPKTPRSQQKTQTDYARLESADNSNDSIFHKRGMMPALGLEIRKVQLERQKGFYEANASVDKVEPIEKPIAILSQELIKSKRKPLELRTVATLKQQSLQTVFEQKARNYRQFIFLVYLGSGAYRDFEPCSEKYVRRMEVKYEYYVGGGNNSNLIKSVMKKRWWWSPTNQITANTRFVWTQRKVDSYIGEQPKEQSFAAEPQLKKQLQSISKGRNSELESQVEIRRLLHRKDMDIYKSYMCSIRKQPHSLSARMKLLNKKPVKELEKDQRVHNHFEQNYFLGNKKALLKNMIDYYTFNKISENNWDIPLTFHVTTQQDAEFKKFQAIFRERQREKLSNVWIVKPGENSNRGQGIKVTRSLKQICSILQNKKHTYVVQQYLTDLFLYNKRKFDIRTYCLVTRLGGVLKAYWYQEGYVRTCAELYQLDDLSDPMVHLTNDAIQKYGQHYGKYEPGNKLSYADLQKYMDSLPGQKHAVSLLVASMKSIAADAIKSCYFKLDPNCRGSNFEIFGLDFIIDSGYKPWLLQVNTNPCLELSSPLLARLIPQMVQNSFKIGLDPVYPPTPCPYNSKPYLSDNVIQKNRFELIFDSQYDRDIGFEVSHKDDDHYEDDDDLYENDGQIVNVQ